MVTIERYGVEAWLGPALAETSEEQVDDLQRAWQRYEDSPSVVALTEADERDDAEDRVAALASYLQVIGEDVGLEAIGARMRAARRELYASIVGAVYAGMSEAEAARRAGVDRMTVRRLTDKR